MVYKKIPGFQEPIPYRKFEEYSPRFKDHFFLDLDDQGILTAKWHTEGKEMLWGPAVHKGIGQLYADVDQDQDIEVFIMGGHGYNYVGEFNWPDPPRGPLTPEERYQIEYYDGCRSVEAIVNMEQPTIGVINGPGYHTEYAIFCDITLIADNAVISDPHFFCHAVPGDGIQIAMRETMGLKQYNYAVLTNQLITAQQAVDMGLANEVVPADRIYERAQELARILLETPRVVRMQTIQVLRTPWRVALASEFRNAFAAEMFASSADETGHDQTHTWPEAIRMLGCKTER